MINYRILPCLKKKIDKNIFIHQIAFEIKSNNPNHSIFYIKLKPKQKK